MKFKRNPGQVCRVVVLARVFHSADAVVDKSFARLPGLGGDLLQVHHAQLQKVQRRQRRVPAQKTLHPGAVSSVVRAHNHCRNRNRQCL